MASRKSYVCTAKGCHCGRLVIMPKIRIDNLMRMVAYAFDLSDLLVTEPHTTYTATDHGLIDLLGLSLLRSVERIARGEPRMVPPTPK